jgi:hypothetical protein
MALMHQIRAERDGGLAEFAKTGKIGISRAGIRRMSGLFVCPLLGLFPTIARTLMVCAQSRSALSFFATLFPGFCRAASSAWTFFSSFRASSSAD